jgi:hypothetical protein
VRFLRPPNGWALTCKRRTRRRRGWRGSCPRRHGTHTTILHRTRGRAEPGNWRARAVCQVQRWVRLRPRDPMKAPGAGLGLRFRDSKRIPARDTGGERPVVLVLVPGGRRALALRADGTPARDTGGVSAPSVGRAPGAACPLPSAAWLSGTHPLGGLIPNVFGSGAAVPSVWSSWASSGALRSAAWNPRAVRRALGPGASAAERLAIQLQM